MLVGGELLDDIRWSAWTVEFAASVEAFVAARRWNQECLSSQPVLQAQAAELEAGTLDLLRGMLKERLPTAGWPTPSQHPVRGST